MKENFSNRELIIITYLKENNRYITSDELASYVGVSNRTVKKDLAHIKSIVNNKEICLTSSTRKGYKFLSKQKPLSRDENIVKDKDMILNNYDQIAYLTQELLLAKKFLRYEDLASEIFVSYSTLNRYMKKVKLLFSQYNLKVIKKPGKGIYITGEEMQMRLAISDYFYHSFLSYLSNFEQNLYNKDSELLKKITNIVYDEVSAAGLRMNSKMIIDISIHVVIAFNRIFKEAALNFPAKFDFEYLGLKEAAVAKHVLQRSQNFFSEHVFTDKTIEYIAYHINLKKYINKEDIIEDKNLAINNTVTGVVKEIKNNFGIDLFSQIDVLCSLKLHLIQLQRRVNNNVFIQGKDTFKYFRNYLFAAKLTISAAKIISENLLSQSLPLSEYGYLILYFQSALEGIRRSTPRFIGLYTENDRSKELIFLKKLNAIKSDKTKVKIIRSKALISNTFDLVISSAPIATKHSLVINNVNQLTQEKVEENYFNKNSNLEILSKYVRKESILKMNASNKHEVNKKIFYYLKRLNFIKKDVINEFEYEEIGNGLVHVQDLYKVIKHDLCLLVILEKPILWNNTVVKMLILIKTKKDGDKDLPLLCEVFSKWSNDLDKIEKTYHVQDFKSLLKLLC